MRKKIKIAMKHDALRIKVTDTDGTSEEFSLPVRCAKIIADLFQFRNSDSNDIRNYSRWIGDNVDYDCWCWVNGIRYGSETGDHVNKAIKKFTAEDLKEVGGSYR